MIGGGQTTDHVHDVFDQDFFHYIHGIVGRAAVVSKPIH